MSIRMETVAAERISPAEYNPRVDLQPGDERYERIARSLDRFGMVDPLVWNERTGNLVGGHQRFKILRARGIAEFTVSVVDLSLEEEKALNITLNSPEIEGAWDGDRLAELLAQVEADKPDLYDEMELSLLRSLTHDSGGEDEAEDEEEAVATDGEHSGPPEMELLPYEHYDYVMLMFKDSRDFIAALDHFDLRKVTPPSYVGSKKIGLGRVIDGGRYMLKIKQQLLALPGTPVERVQSVVAHLPPEQQWNVLTDALAKLKPVLTTVPAFVEEPVPVEEPVNAAEIA